MTELERVFEQLKSSPNKWSIRKIDDTYFIDMDAVDFVILCGMPSTDVLQRSRPYIKFDKHNDCAGYMNYYDETADVTAWFDDGFLERNKDYFDDL